MSAPRVAVVVATYNRAAYLAELVGCLAAQTLGTDHFEVVIVDNGSTDHTPATLARLKASTPLAVTTLRVDTNRGPGGGRNAGAALTRAPIIAITDDDCLPIPGWLARLLTAFDDPNVVVAQGRVGPDPATADSMGPFDHTITVRGPTPFFETCNVAYRRDAFERAGGFDEHDPLLHPKSGRAFGEDALLGRAVLRDGTASRAFVDDAVVIHRCVSRTFGDALADQRQLRLFPGLARRTPLLRELFFGGVFLNPTSAAFDLALVGVLAAVALRQPWLLAAALPWLGRRGRTTSWFAGRNLTRWPRILVKYAVSDAVAFASLVEGSVRFRRLLL